MGLLGDIVGGFGAKKQAGKQNRILRKAAAQIPGFDSFRALEEPLSARFSSRLGDFQFGDDTGRAISDITGRATPFRFDISEAGPLRNAVSAAGLEGLSDFSMPFDRARSRVREDALGTAIKEGRTGGALQQGVVDAVGEFEERLIPMQEQIRQGRVSQAQGILSSLVDQLFREQSGAEGITANRLESARAATMGRDLSQEQATVGRLTQALQALGLPFDAAVQKANILIGQRAAPNNMQIFGNALGNAEDGVGQLAAAYFLGG